MLTRSSEDTTYGHYQFQKIYGCFPHRLATAPWKVTLAYDRRAGYPRWLRGIHEETGYGASSCYRPGATDIVINEVLNTDFEIVSIGTPTKGTVMKVNDRTLQWKIAQLGTSSIEEASLEFTVRHVGQTEGLRQVNQSVTYSRPGKRHRVTFPDPLPGRGVRYGRR